MDQETEKTCRYSNLIDYKSCSKRKQPRTFNRNDKLLFFVVNATLWTIFLAFTAMRQPGDGVGLAVIGLEVASITVLTLHSLLQERLRPRRLAADIRRFPQGCCPSHQDGTAHSNPYALTLAARQRCQSEKACAAYETLGQSEVKTERIVISAAFGTFALFLAGIIWWIACDIKAEHIPMTPEKTPLQNQLITSSVSDILVYGMSAILSAAILAFCIYTVASIRRSNAFERILAKKREKALAALERLPTGYRIAAVQPDYTEESLECRLARIPHHLRSPDIEDYIASVDPVDSGYMTYPTRTCGA